MTTVAVSKSDPETLYVGTDKGFEQFQYGYASAMMLISFVAVLIVGIVQYRIVKTRRLGMTD